MRTHTAHGDDGFTLIELLVVVVIIGILATIAIPTFLSQREQGYRATLQSDLRNAAVQAEAFFHRHDTYENFENSPAFLGSARSPGVVMTLDAADSQSNSYCIEAVLVTQTWNIQTNPVLGSPSLAEGAC